MDAPIIYTDTANEAALTIGTAGSYNATQRFRLRVQRTNQSNWSNNACIGVRLYGCTHCDIDIDECTGYTIGVQCMGDTAGFAYNRLRLGDLRDNRYGVVCTNNASGW
jgi:hypothetical protein